MSNQLLPQKAKGESKAVILDDDNIREEHSYFVPEAVTLELLWMSQPCPNPYHSKKPSALKSPPVVLHTTRRILPSCPHCTCTALTLPKFTQEPTEIVLAPHFVWSSTSVSTGTLAPSLWGKRHFILCHHKSGGDHLVFTLVKGRPVWFEALLKAVERKETRQDVNKIK